MRPPRDSDFRTAHNMTRHTILWSNPSKKAPRLPGSALVSTSHIQADLIVYANGILWTSLDKTTFCGRRCLCQLKRCRHHHSLLSRKAGDCSHTVDCPTALMYVCASHAHQKYIISGDPTVSDPMQRYTWKLWGAATRTVQDMVDLRSPATPTSPAAPGCPCRPATPRGLLLRQTAFPSVSPPPVCLCSPFAICYARSVP